jgi:hypothetical protein
MTQPSLGFGIRIIEDANLVDPHEDWSGVRSPGRARRRQRYGYRQNIVIRHKPKDQAYSIDNGRTLIMHPDMAASFRAATKLIGQPT